MMNLMINLVIVIILIPLIFEFGEMLCVMIYEIYRDFTQRVLRLIIKLLRRLRK